MRHNVQPICWPPAVDTREFCSLQLTTAAPIQTLLDLPPHNAQLAADAVMLRRLSSTPRVAISTVQLVAKCRVSPSLYSRWLRPEPSSWAVEVIAIRLVRDRKWSPRITGDLIAIKCWSRQALLTNILSLNRIRCRTGSQLPFKQLLTDNPNSLHLLLCTCISCNYRLTSHYMNTDWLHTNNASDNHGLQFPWKCLLT